jgi:2-keto-3-deoxy-L-rhamnonate aldolase RhmA
MKFQRFYDAKVGNGFAFGTHCWSQDPSLYEICGHLGYDYIWIDNEHGGMTFPMINSGIIAANSGGAAAIVRVPGHQVEDVKPVLEMGPQGIVFPMVNSAEEAEQVVKLCQYPPKGSRSYGPLRAIDYYETPLDKYLAEVENKTLRFIQCEHVDAVNNLDEILEVPGVDVIICGPMDLSASVGKLGQLTDPEVVGMMDTIIKKCTAAKKPFGISVGANWTLAKEWLSRGASFVSVASVYDYYSIMSKDIISQINDMR